MWYYQSHVGNPTRGYLYGHTAGKRGNPTRGYLYESEEIMSKYTVSKIKLNATKEVEEFVSAAGKCDFDIDIFYNRMIIDAKSILGILSMDLNNVLTVHCYGEDPEFSNTLRKFAVA